MESTATQDQHPDLATPNYSKPSVLRTSSVSSRHRASSASSTSNSIVTSTSSPDDVASSSSPTGSIIATPPPPSSGRKRLSINFALPVLPSLSSPLASTTGATLPTASTASATNGASSLRRNRSLHTHSASVSLPPLAGSTPSSRQLSSPNSSSTTTTTSSPPNSAAARSSHKPSASVSYETSSMSSGLSSPPGSTKPTSAIETYFSQLAYKERRVNDLREQIKQLEGLLREAEEDFSEFRVRVPSELASTVGTTISSTVPAAPAAGSAGAAHPGLSTPKTALSRSNTFTSSRISPPSKNGAPFSLDGAMSDAHPQPYQPPNKRHSLITSPGAGLLGGGLSRSNSVSEGSHEFNAGLPLPPSKNHYQQQPADSSDVFNKGRKVVEEIGTQFWSFIDGHNPAGAPAGPDGAEGTDSGLPNLAMLQQQHENPSSGGFRPTAPPRKPRRQYGGDQPQAAPVLLSMPPHNPKPQSPSSQQSYSPVHRRMSSGMKGPLLGTPPKKTGAAGGKHDETNSYYMI